MCRYGKGTELPLGMFVTQYCVLNDSGSGWLPILQVSPLPSKSVKMSYLQTKALSHAQRVRRLYKEALRQTQSFVPLRYMLSRSLDHTDHYLALSTAL